MSKNRVLVLFGPNEINFSGSQIVENFQQNTKKMKILLTSGHIKKVCHRKRGRCNKVREGGGGVV